MAILKVDTISGIGTEGPVFEGDIEFTSQNFLTLPKGNTTDAFPDFKAVPAAQLSGLSAVVPDGGTKKYGEVSSVLPRRSGVPPYSFLKLLA